MNSKTHVWFDLEGTLIPEWSYIEQFIHMDDVRELLNKYNPEDIGIFSYAVHTEDDVCRVRDSNLIEWLRGELSVVKILTTGHMLSHWEKYRYGSSTIRHLTNPYDIWKLPKEYSFIMSMTGMYGDSYGGTFVLYDDTVGQIPNMKVGDNEFVFVYAEPSES